MSIMFAETGVCKKSATNRPTDRAKSAGGRERGEEEEEEDMMVGVIMHVVVYSHWRRKGAWMKEVCCPLPSYVIVTTFSCVIERSVSVTNAFATNCSCSAGRGGSDRLKTETHFVHRINLCQETAAGNRGQVVDKVHGMYIGTPMSWIRRTCSR